MHVDCEMQLHLLLQDYALAARIYEELAEEDEERKGELLSAVGRLYLQVRWVGRKGGRVLGPVG